MEVMQNNIWYLYSGFAVPSRTAWYGAYRTVPATSICKIIYDTYIQGLQYRPVLFGMEPTVPYQYCSYIKNSPESGPLKKN